MQEKIDTIHQNFYMCFITQGNGTITCKYKVVIISSMLIKQLNYRSKNLQNTDISSKFLNAFVA